MYVYVLSLLLMAIVLYIFKSITHKTSVKILIDLNYLFRQVKSCNSILKQRASANCAEMLYTNSVWMTMRANTNFETSV